MCRFPANIYFFKGTIDTLEAVVKYVQSINFATTSMTSF